MCSLVAQRYYAVHASIRKLQRVSRTDTACIVTDRLQTSCLTYKDYNTNALHVRSSVPYFTGCMPCESSLNKGTGVWHCVAKRSSINPFECVDAPVMGQEQHNEHSNVVAPRSDEPVQVASRVHVTGARGKDVSVTVSILSKSKERLAAISRGDMVGRKDIALKSRDMHAVRDKGRRNDPCAGQNSVKGRETPDRSDRSEHHKTKRGQPGESELRWLYGQELGWYNHSLLRKVDCLLLWHTLVRGCACILCDIRRNHLRNQLVGRYGQSFSCWL